jgi:cytochrome b involved in lipid metabolism
MNKKQIPSRLVLQGAARTNHALGHENLGFLSESHGFMPCHPPLPKLPPAFKAWDELASRLPELYRTLALRSEIDALDVLETSKASLPDAYLLRASALLSILAHAYYHVETKSPRAIPDGIRIPWQEVSQRLGKPQPVLSYIDLIVYNWQLIDSSRHDPMRLDNLQLLIPTVDNNEERIFYLTQVEILAQCTPIVGAVVRAQEAASRGDAEALKRELLTISQTLQTVTHESLPQISPKTSSKTFMDPVVWAKTVAPLAVAITPTAQGPSGTSSPIFNLLDVFFGRQRFDSHLGREIIRLRHVYPKHWQDFLAAVAQVSVADYVEKAEDKALTETFQEALASYAGERGFLGRHRLKVYGYLQLAFKVGRSVTNTGFSGVFKERTWNQVDDELEVSRRERFSTASTAPLAPQPAIDSDPSRLYDVSDIVLHNSAATGYWLVLDGQVYDLTPYLNRHPGGAHVLRSYAGLDATKAFHRIHGCQPAMAKVLKSYHLGAVRALSLKDERRVPAGEEGGGAIALTTAYRLWVNILYLVVEIENALEQDLSLQQAQTTRGEDGSTWSPYKLQLAWETHARFMGNVVEGVLGEAVTDLWTATRQLGGGASTTPDVVQHLTLLRSSHHAARLRQFLREMELITARFADGSLSPASPLANGLVRACRFMTAEDQHFIRELKNALRDGVMVFEKNHDAQRLFTAASSLPEALSVYYVKLLEELEKMPLSAERALYEGFLMQ